MTWDDYRPIPGTNWARSVADADARTLRVALVAVDFEDQPFVITLPKQSDLFGNPQIDPVAREDVAAVLRGLLGQAGPAQSRPHDPRVLDGAVARPRRHPDDRRLRSVPDAEKAVPVRTQRTQPAGRLPDRLHLRRTAWSRTSTSSGPKAAGADIKQKYDIVLRIYAGYDETSVWQEFGEMKFEVEGGHPGRVGQSRHDEAALGADALRAVDVVEGRRAAVGPVVGAPGRELRHDHARDRALRVSRPATTTTIRTRRRTAASAPGPWDIMDRGSFNGPGGPHRRWVVPAAAGASMPAGFMLRNRLRYGWLAPEQVLQLTRSGLAQSGLAVATRHRARRRSASRAKWPASPSRSTATRRRTARRSAT